MITNSDLYKLGLFEAMRGQSGQSYVEAKQSQSHFYAGELLRSRTLEAISGGYTQPFSVSSVALDF
jgi:hypothetical protein